MTTKKEIAKLTKMKLNELQAKFAEVTGETTRSPNKTFLIRKIVEAVRVADASSKAVRAPEAGTPDVEAEGSTTQTESVAVDGKLTRLRTPDLGGEVLGGMEKWWPYF
jgi:hypothetical protein